MRRFLHHIIAINLVIICMFPVNRCLAQAGRETVNRMPVYSGQFYPADPENLRSMLDQLFTGTSARVNANKVLAIISPHAGYPYSGTVAAYAFSQIDPYKKYDHIFILGPGHRVSFAGASIYNRGHYRTPLGLVRVDIDLANRLIREHRVFSFQREAHLFEHCLEVQLPFLQTIMQEECTIVPVVFGTRSADVCRDIARALNPFFNERNLFIISTDFSHYPSSRDACRVDSMTMQAITSRSPGVFMETIQNHREKNIPNLETPICGWTPVLTLLHMMEDKEDLRVVPVEYQNSGDSGIGNDSRVVGYWSACVVKGSEKMEKQKNTFHLSEGEKKQLLALARRTIEEYLKNGTLPEEPGGSFSPDMCRAAGAFVTIHKKGSLRGCIGRFNPDQPLYRIVQEMAVSAACKDPRFRPVEKGEIDSINIEISVLTPLDKIEDIDEIIPGKHGIYIKKGIRSGTFLPQVARETGWDREELLSHCAAQKAGIGADGWKNAEIFTYEALVFSEKEF